MDERFTPGEIRKLRKILQAANLLYTAMEKEFTTNEADKLLQKLRRMEQEAEEEERKWTEMTESEEDAHHEIQSRYDT